MAVGWQVPEPSATLVLDVPPYEGGEIEVRLSLSPAVYFGVSHWWDALRGAKGREAMEGLRGLSETFAEYGLIAWNLERDGEPIPTTPEGVASLDQNLILTLVSTWFKAVGTVPLPGASSGASPARRNGQRPASTSGSSNAATSRRKSTRSRT